MAAVVGCSASGAQTASAYRGAGGVAASEPDAGVAGNSGASASGGASGSGGTIGAVVSGGSGAVDAGRPFDPSATFDWPEAVEAGTCQAGTYSGSYDCTVDYSGIIFPIAGKVSFMLTPSANGEFLEIKDGKLFADVQGGVTLNADLAGRLDCLTNKFDATIQNGTYTVTFLGVPINNQPFAGDLSGVLDRLTSTLSGQWHLVSVTPLPGGAMPSCVGPWNVVLQP
jgi:hypothetical protein